VTLCDRRTSAYGADFSIVFQFKIRKTMIIDTGLDIRFDLLGAIPVSHSFLLPVSPLIQSEERETIHQLPVSPRSRHKRCA